MKEGSMSGKFSKNKEDFKCEHCGFETRGTGYTNHCPRCLWSRHVDINPGDRKEKCGGMMELIKTEYLRGEFIIVHRCVKCGIQRRNTASKDDNVEALKTNK
jgi:hypothetical protein